MKSLKSLFQFLFGATVLKLRLKSLHKYSANVHRLDKAIQGSDLSSDVKAHSAALARTYTSYVSLLSVGASPDYDKLMKENVNNGR